MFETFSKKLFTDLATVVRTAPFILISPKKNVLSNGNTIILIIFSEKLVLKIPVSKT